MDFEVAARVPALFESWLRRRFVHKPWIHLVRNFGKEALGGRDSRSLLGRWVHAYPVREMHLLRARVHQPDVARGGADDRADFFRDDGQ